MKGKIVSWKDDKGFGFITPEGKSEQVFFHISSVKKAARKPEVGDVVIFEAAKDSKVASKQPMCYLKVYHLQTQALLKE